MAKNRYAKPADGTRKTVTGVLKFLAGGNKKIQPVELWMLNAKVNRNNWRYENLQDHLQEFLNIPILIAYVNGGKTIGDGHNYDMRRGKDGTPYASFTAADAERIVGWIDADANVRLEKDEKGVEWVVSSGNLWRYYAQELVEILAEQGGDGLSISIETLILEEHREGTVEVEDRYVVLGVTILGNGVDPAVPGASIRTLAELNALRTAMQPEIIKAASYAPHKNAKTAEKGVKTMLIPKRRLEEWSQSFNGYTCVGVSDDMKTLALIDDKNVPYVYTISDTDAGNIIPERIERATSAVVTVRAGTAEAPVELDTILDAAGVNSLVADRDNFKSLSEKLAAEIAVMKARERARRLTAAKDAMENELACRNEARTEDMQFSADICNELAKQIENGAYTDMEDEDGNWTGEKAVRNAVSALCMDEQTRMDKEARRREGCVFSYGDIAKRNNAAAPETIGDLLASGNY